MEPLYIIIILIYYYTVLYKIFRDSHPCVGILDLAPDVRLLVLDLPDANHFCVGGESAGLCGGVLVTPILLCHNFVALLNWDWCRFFNILVY